MVTEALKPLLETYAYNILGSYEDARDVVQDVWLKILEKPLSGVENEKAYLIKSVINHAINVKERQKRFIKDYTGPWLPEPVATGEQADASMQRKEVLSYSLMVLMEKLNPRERAVFILKEAFNYAHEEIAVTLDVSEDNSRQLLRRAKSRLKEDNTYGGRKLSTSLEPGQLFAAIQDGNVARLEELLHKDIVITSDGGGKVTAARVPVRGQHNASRFLLGLYQKFYKYPGVRVVPAVINHQPALLYYLEDALVNCQIITIEGGLVSNVYFVRNPDKLKNIQKIT